MIALKQNRICYLPGEIGLYFHIPVCRRKCPYCHFYVLPDSAGHQEALMHGLKLEWQQAKKKLSDKKIVSVYFGGGTPALLAPQLLGEIISWIKPHLNHADVEFTVEANPEDVSYEQLQQLFMHGVNRISIGIQAFDNEMLEKLGRHHTARQAAQAVTAAYDAGIRNISVDVMYDLPGHTLGKWEQTLDQVCRLPITHLSLYNLVIEPGTVFYKQRDDLYSSLPSQEESADMYRMALDRLPSIGLEQYEISAFCKPGMHSRHNTGYWLARPFLGFGPSAYSYWNNARFRNIANLRKYIKMLEGSESPVDYHEDLGVDARRKELFIVALRMNQGVDMIDFENHHGKLGPETLDSLRTLENQGFITRTDSLLQLSSTGRLFYDTVASELI